MEGKLDLLVLKREAACIGMVLIKNAFVVSRKVVLSFISDREEK